jgi:hypothetical protein
MLRIQSSEHIFRIILTCVLGPTILSIFGTEVFENSAVFIFYAVYFCTVSSLVQPTPSCLGLKGLVVVCCLLLLLVLWYSYHFHFYAMLIEVMNFLCRSSSCKAGSYLGLTWDPCFSLYSSFLHQRWSSVYLWLDILLMTFLIIGEFQLWLLWLSSRYM